MQTFFEIPNFLSFFKVVFRKGYWLDFGLPVFFQNPTMYETGGGAGKSYLIQMCFQFPFRLNQFFRNFIFLKTTTINWTILVVWLLVDAFAHFRRSKDPSLCLNLPQHSANLLGCLCFAEYKSALSPWLGSRQVDCSNPSNGHFFERFFTIGKPIRYTFVQSICGLVDGKYCSATAPLVH